MVRKDWGTRRLRDGGSGTHVFLDHNDNMEKIQPHSGGRYGSPGWSETEPGVTE